MSTELAESLDQLGNCFERSELWTKLATYVRGQLGELPRKSVKPIAQAAGMNPHTLQDFLASDDWDEERLQTHTFGLMLRDHRDQLIGVIDELEHPKTGTATAGSIA